MHPLLHYVSTKYRLSVSLELQKGRCVLCRLERPACTKQRPYKNPASQPASRKDFNPSLDRCNLPLDTLSAACMYSLRLALNHLGYPVKDHNTDFSPPPNPPPAHHPHINSLSPPLTYPWWSPLAQPRTELLEDWACLVLLILTGWAPLEVPRREDIYIIYSTHWSTSKSHVILHHAVSRRKY